MQHDWLMIGPCWATPAAFSQVLACALLVFYRREKVGSMTTLGHGLPHTRNVLVDLRRFCRFKNAADMRLREITESAADIFVTLHVEAVKPRQLAGPEFNQLKGSVHSISLLCAVWSNGSAKRMTDHFGQTFFNVDWERVPSFCW